MAKPRATHSESEPVRTLRAVPVTILTGFLGARKTTLLNRISPANGCVCCNIRDDLLVAVTQVIERPERPEYIVLEASGVVSTALSLTLRRIPDSRNGGRLGSIGIQMSSAR
jgi:G3E family GTPase